MGKNLDVCYLDREVVVNVDLDHFLAAYAWAAHAAAKDAMVDYLQAIHFTIGPPQSHVPHFNHATFAIQEVPEYAISMVATDRYRVAWASIHPLVRIEEGGSEPPAPIPPVAVGFEFSIHSQIVSDIVKSWPRLRRQVGVRTLRIQLHLDETSQKVTGVAFTVASSDMVMTSTATPMELKVIPNLRNLVQGKPPKGEDDGSEGTAGFTPLYIAQLATIADRVCHGSLTINLNRLKPARFAGNAEGRWFSALIMPVRLPN